MGSIENKDYAPQRLKEQDAEGKLTADAVLTIITLASLINIGRSNFICKGKTIVHLQSSRNAYGAVKCARSSSKRV